MEDLRSMVSDTILIISDEGEKTKVGVSEIVYLNGLKTKFWDRVDASIDLGVNGTKANDLRQLSIQSALGYLADK